MKWRRTLLIAAAVVAASVVSIWFWLANFGMGTGVPGPSYFRTYLDSAHGMANTCGTFKFVGGEEIYLVCWSPHKLMRDKFVKFVIYRPSHRVPEMKDTLAWAERYAKLKDTLMIRAGKNTFIYDGSYGDPKYDSIVPTQEKTFWPDDEMTREQLREIASAHQVEFDIGRETPLMLSEDQLADIRAFLAYTDKLPEFDPRPRDMRNDPP